MTHPSVNSIVERLQFDAARCELQFSKGVAENISEAATIISELQAENRRLQRALMFWMPGVDLRLDKVTREQCANDAGLLAGYSGPLAGRRWGNEIIDTVAGLQAMLEEARTEARLMRENWSEAEDRALAAESSLAELQATVKRLTANPADQRYWEGRYRDEAAALSRIKEETIEECARVAEGTAPIARGNFFEARRKQTAKIASAIRSLGSTGGAKKTAESDHSPSTPTTETE